MGDKNYTLHSTVNGKPFYIRPNTSDLNIFNQIFGAGNYDLHHTPFHREMLQIYATLLKPVIIDAGANIGASAVFFAQTFPRAEILAIEPEASNFELLKLNTSPYPQITLLNAAVGSFDGFCATFHPHGAPIPGRGHAAFRTDISPETTIKNTPLHSLNRLLETFAEYFFIVKIDIEGAEKELFSTNLQWVNKTALIAIELHDWLYPEEAPGTPFRLLANSLNYPLFHRGEDTFMFNPNFRP